MPLTYNIGWAQESDSYVLKYLALSCTSCVTLDKLLIVSTPQFADLSKGILVLPWWDCWELLDIMLDMKWQPSP